MTTCRIAERKKEMFILLKQLHHQTVYEWNSEKTELKFIERGDLVISTDQISFVEPEKVDISDECTKKMPEEFRNKFYKEPPTISKITLKNDRQFLVKESPQEIRCMLSEES